MMNFSCFKCHQSYNASDRQPLILPCNDTLCKLCLIAIEQRCTVKKNKKTCPKCDQIWDKSLVKHLQMVKDMIPSPNSHSTAVKSNEENFQSSVLNNQHENQATIDELNAQTCLSHRMLGEFWCNSHLSVLCSGCIKETHVGCSFTPLKNKLIGLSKELSAKEKMADDILQQVSNDLDVSYKSVDRIIQFISALEDLKYDFESYVDESLSRQKVLKECSDGFKELRDKMTNGYVPIKILEEQSAITCKFTRSLKLSDSPPNPMAVLNGCLQVTFFMNLL